MQNMSLRMQVFVFVWIMAMLACSCSPISTRPQISDYIKIDMSFERKISALKGDVKALDNPDMLTVNKFVNAFKYKREKKGRDYWKLPDEFYADGGGDCEDFAIAKYHALKGNHDVLLLVGYNKERKIAHGVLLVDKTIVLDNNHTEIRSYSQFIQEYEPAYVADSVGVRLVNSKANNSQGGSYEH